MFAGGLSVHSLCRWNRSEAATAATSRIPTHQAMAMGGLSPVRVGVWEEYPRQELMVGQEAAPGSETTNPSRHAADRYERSAEVGQEHHDEGALPAASGDLVRMSDGGGHPRDGTQQIRKPAAASPSRPSVRLRDTLPATGCASACEVTMVLPVGPVGASRSRS